MTKYEGYGDTMYTVTITRVVDDSGHVGKNGFCGPMLKAKVSPGREKLMLWKTGVCDQLDPTSNKFRENTSYELYNQLTSARFLASCNLVFDLRQHLARVSELAQRDDLSQFSLKRKVLNFEKDVKVMM